MKAKLNTKGFRELRNDPKVIADLEARAKRIAEAAGTGFEASSQRGATRGRASVVAGTLAARRKAAADPAAVLRAIERGR